MNRQYSKAAKAAIKRGQRLGKSIGAPDQAQHTAGPQNPPRSLDPALKRLGSRYMRHLASLVGRGAVPHGIVEWQIHQDHIDTIWTKARSDKGTRRRCYVQHDHIGRNRVKFPRSLASQGRERGVDFHQHKRNSADRLATAKPAAPTPETKVHNAIARSGGRCGRQQHGIMAGAMT